MHIGSTGGSFRKSDYRGILKPQQQPQDGLLRSDTFTIQDEDSILVKAKNSAKSSMFAKLGTFTRSKKKSSPQRNEELTSGTYKSWQRPNDHITSTTDPFGILYSSNQNSASKVESVKKPYEKSPVSYDTYRKSKVPSQVRQELQEIKDENENSDDRDKFKTVTINSFRKSFRQRFLNPKKEAPHNPAWFIEVDPPKTEEGADERGRSREKDLLVFRNDNYKPNARSPVRESPPVPKPRTTVKRNETFRVAPENTEPSIRIEIKNSITPNEPGRMVPVGVAKPMPATNQSDRSNIIQRTWMEPGRNSSQNLYQTTIQITDQDHHNSPPRYNDSYFRRSYTPSSQTRIQISGNNNQSRNTKDSFISNYSPLTSYGILSKMKQTPESVPDNSNRSSQRHKSPRDHYTEAAQPYDAKKCSQAPTISSRQKMTTYFGDHHGVRKDAINTNRNALNNRRPQMKAPWR